MRTPWARPVAVTIVAVYVAGATAMAVVAGRLRGVAPVDQPLLEAVSFLVAFGAFTVVGALIITNRPRHPVGWIFAAIGLALGVLPIGNEYTGYLIATGREPSTAVLLFAWLNNWYWYALLYLLMVLLPLLFPTGRPPNRRWWVVGLAGGLATALLCVLGALAATVDGQNFAWSRPSPVGIEGLPFVEDIAWIGPVFVVFAASVIGAVASFVVRFRRSTGDERQQLKWFVFAVLLLPIMVVPDAAVEDIAVLEALLFPTAVSLLPVAAGIAILRYRLYDIDVVISRTLVFAVLAAFITGVYVAVVVGVGSRRWGGRGPEPGVVDRGDGDRGGGIRAGAVAGAAVGEPVGVRAPGDALRGALRAVGTVGADRVGRGSVGTAGAVVGRWDWCGGDGLAADR